MILYTRFPLLHTPTRFALGNCRIYGCHLPPGLCSCAFKAADSQAVAADAASLRAVATFSIPFLQIKLSNRDRFHFWSAGSSSRSTRQLPCALTSVSDLTQVTHLSCHPRTMQGFAMQLVHTLSWQSRAIYSPSPSLVI